MRNKIVCPIPVLGRLPLVEMTIQRLLKQKVIPIIVGHEKGAYELAMKYEIEFVQHVNHPLGAKWNAGFIAAKKYNPDAVLFAGSSDWCSDEYIREIRKHTNKYALLGSLTCHFVDVSDTIRLVEWHGYNNMRKNEAIGIGRVLNKSFLNQIQWQPFDSRLDNSLDYSMWKKATELQIKIGILPSAKEVSLLSISTNKWNNKHRFHEHLNGKLDSTLVSNELLNNFNKIYNL